MEKKTPRWESELWSYLSSGDGIHCPIYQSCKLRDDQTLCLSDQRGSWKVMDDFTDNDNPDLANPLGTEFKFSFCPRRGKIFKLVRRLASMYQDEAAVYRPPVPTNLITRTDDGLTIEVRQVPLKAYRGSVWKLPNCWVVQLNSNNSPARQRFTLYHEIFHILANSKANPVFKKVALKREGSFNEMLADHFATACLLPEKWVKQLWPEVRDTRKIAALFEAPVPIVWFVLKDLCLI